MCLRPDTVRTYLRRLYRRFNVTTRVELALIMACSTWDAADGFETTSGGKWKKSDGVTHIFLNTLGAGLDSSGHLAALKEAGIALSSR